MNFKWIDSINSGKLFDHIYTQRKCKCGISWYLYGIHQKCCFKMNATK